MSSLCKSWCSQYADYIGSEAAADLVSKARASGEIYAHNAQGSLVAKLQDEVVGVTAVRDLEKLFLITILEVVPEHQGKGIANQLLTAICTVRKPVMVHVSIHRPWLTALYEKHGFKTLGPEEVDHYGHSLVFDVMVKAVSPLEI